MHSARLWFLVFPELDPMRGGSFGFFTRRMPLRFSIYGLQTRPAVAAVCEISENRAGCAVPPSGPLRLTTRGRERIRSPGGAIFPVVEAGKRSFKVFTASFPRAFNRPLINGQAKGKSSAHPSPGALAVSVSRIPRPCYFWRVFVPQHFSVSTDTARHAVHVR